AAFADLLAAVDVEDADLSQLGPGGLARGGDEVARRDVFGDGDGDVLPDRGIGDDVLVGHRLARVRKQTRQIELERAPRACDPTRMQFTEDAPDGLRRPARMEERVRGSPEVTPDFQRAVEDLDHALDVEEVALADPSHPEHLARQLL